MCAGVLVATSRGLHEPMEYIRLLLDLSGTGDDIRCVIVGNSVIGDVESVQLHTLACSLNTFPAFKNPDKIDTVRFQGIHRINTQRHMPEYALAAIFLDDLTHNRTFVGSTKAPIDLAIKHSGTRQS